MMHRPMILSALALPAILGAWSLFHLDLVDSLPRAEQVLEAAPEVVWLEFSAAPDLSRSTFSIRGPEGRVELSDMEVGEKEEVLQARVVGPMLPGVYTLSWVGAPLDDHPVRGRFEFTVATTR